MNDLFQTGSNRDTGEKCRQESHWMQKQRTIAILQLLIHEQAVAGKFK